MAHLSKYTFSKLCSTVNVRKEIDLELFCAHIYDDREIYLMLNKREVKYLFNYKSILDDENHYLLEYYEEVPEREDHHNYVFEKAGKAKYHTNATCQYLNSDYVDFRVPPEIKELGIKEIELFRTWFKLKGYAEQFFAGTLDIAKMTFEYNSYFPPRLNIKPLNEDYQLVLEIPNGEKRQSETEFDVVLFRLKLKQLKDGFQNIFSSPVLRTLSKFQYLVQKSDEEIHEKFSEIFSASFVQNYGIDNIREKLEFSAFIKKELIANLLQYFKWTFKFDSKNFDIIALEKFGLECCSGCEKNKHYIFKPSGNSRHD